MGDAEAPKSGLKATLDSYWWNTKEKGGFRSCIFLYVMIALENMAFIANMVSLVLYFRLAMHFDIATSSNTLTNFLGSAFLLSIVGGFISDTYLNRFHTVLIFGVIEVLALVMVTIQSKVTRLQPPDCGKRSCVEGNIAFMFYLSLCLLALGSGGVRGALPALGADQFDEKNPKQAKALASYFNWVTLSTVLGAVVGVTIIVWVSINKGWYKGFIITTLVTFVAFIVLATGKSFYRLRQPGESPMIRIAQVIVLAFKNRKLSLPEDINELYEIKDVEENIAHTDQFRFLDKAAINMGDTKTLGPTAVCSVTQVEEVKILTRMLPILASTIIMNTCLAQLQTFSVQQGLMMNLSLHKFDVPAPSLPVIPLIFMSILIPTYEFFFVPFARNLTGHPSGITQLQRVGVGLVLSAISMAVAALVEVKRRNQSLKDPFHPISLFWLSFQYGIFGIADMFTLVGLLEFFYKESPSGMKSLSTSFTWLSLSFGYFLSTVFVETINAVTKRVTRSKQGWLHGDDLNDNNLDLFYWFLSILSVLNFINYLIWASWYKYKKDDANADTSTCNIDEPKNANVATSLTGGSIQSQAESVPAAPVMVPTSTSEANESTSGLKADDGTVVVDANASASNVETNASTSTRMVDASARTSIVETNANANVVEANHTESEVASIDNKKTTNTETK